MREFGLPSVSSSTVTSSVPLRDTRFMYEFYYDSLLELHKMGSMSTDSSSDRVNGNLGHGHSSAQASNTLVMLIVVFERTVSCCKCSKVGERVFVDKHIDLTRNY